MLGKLLQFLKDHGLFQGLAGALIAASVVVLQYRNEIVENRESILVVDTKKYKLVEEQHLKGWFADYDTTKTTQVLWEDVWLRYYSNPDAANSRVVRMRSSGDVYEHGAGYTNKTWEGAGFESDGYLRIAYLSTKEGTSFTHGVYVLERVGQVYQGYWEGKDSLSRNTIRGAYYLTADLESDKESVVKIFKAFLKPEIYRVSISEGGAEELFFSPPISP